MKEGKGGKMSAGCVNAEFTLCRQASPFTITSSYRVCLFLQPCNQATTVTQKDIFYIKIHIFKDPLKETLHHNRILVKISKAYHN